MDERIVQSGRAGRAVALTVSDAAIERQSNMGDEFAAIIANTDADWPSRIHVQLWGEPMVPSPQAAYVWLPEWYPRRPSLRDKLRLTPRVVRPLFKIADWLHPGAAVRKSQRYWSDLDLRHIIISSFEYQKISILEDKDKSIFIHVPIMLNESWGRRVAVEVMLVCCRLAIYLLYVTAVRIGLTLVARLLGRSKSLWHAVVLLAVATKNGPAVQRGLDRLQAIGESSERLEAYSKYAGEDTFIKLMVTAIRGTEDEEVRSQ